MLHYCYTPSPWGLGWRTSSLRPFGFCWWSVWVFPHWLDWSCPVGQKSTKNPSWLFVLHIETFNHKSFSWEQDLVPKILPHEATKTSNFSSVVVQPFHNFCAQIDIQSRVLPSGYLHDHPVTWPQWAVWPAAPPETDCCLSNSSTLHRLTRCCFTICHRKPFSLSWSEWTQKRLVINTTW